MNIKIVGTNSSNKIKLIKNVKKSLSTLKSTSNPTNKHFNNQFIIFHKEMQSNNDTERWIYMKAAVVYAKICVTFSCQFMENRKILLCQTKEDFRHHKYHYLFCKNSYLLFHNIPQVTSAQLYCVMYSPWNAGIPVCRKQ